MTARISGFLSRSQLKMIPPRSISRNITPGRGGCVTHYGGPAQRIRTHGDCIITWLAWQKYHMETHGWVDIAYTAGYCQHGFVFAGRGHGIRTAAQGTDVGNQNHYAFVWIGGEGQVPTLEALDALEWLVRDARINGGAGTAVRDHSDFKSTSCSGPYIRAHGRTLHNINIPDGMPQPPAPAPEPEPEEEDIMASLEDLERIVRQHTGTLRERANEAVRLGEVAAAGTIADIRAGLGLPADPVSDDIHVGRLRRDTAGTYDLAHVRGRLEKAVAAKASAMDQGAQDTDLLRVCRMAEGTDGEAS